MGGGGISRKIDPSIRTDEIAYFRGIRKGREREVFQSFSFSLFFNDHMENTS